MFVFDGNRQVIHYLVEVCGFSTRMLDNSLRSPLHLACSKGHLATVVYLLKNQVSPTVRHKCSSLAGRTFLADSSKHCHEIIVMYNEQIL